MTTNLSRARHAAALAAVFLLCCTAAMAAKDGKDKDRESRKHFALIFGTAYGPDDRPLYGARIEVRSQGRGKWELVSDHRGEFAQRVPPGPGDYVIAGEAEIAPVENGKVQSNKKRRLQGQVTVHVDAEERQDINLHLK